MGRGPLSRESVINTRKKLNIEIDFRLNLSSFNPDIRITKKVGNRCTRERKLLNYKYGNYNDLWSYTFR